MSCFVFPCRASYLGVHSLGAGLLEGLSEAGQSKGRTQVWANGCLSKSFGTASRKLRLLAIHPPVFLLGWGGCQTLQLNKLEGRVTLFSRTKSPCVRVHSVGTGLLEGMLGGEVEM